MGASQRGDAVSQQRKMMAWCDHGHTCMLVAVNVFPNFPKKKVQTLVTGDGEEDGDNKRHWEV